MGADGEYSLFRATFKLYVRVHEFRAIHIERDAILKAVSELFKYVQRVNGAETQLTGTVKLGRDEFSTELDFPIGPSDYDKFPRIGTSLYVRIQARDAPIDSVELWLADIWQKIEVRGNSHDHVTGLIRVAEEKLNFYETYFGGRGFRFALAAVFYLFYMIAIIPNWFGLKGRDQAVAYGISLVLVNILLFLPAWDVVFPGFLAGIENRSFLERNSAIFTFIGLLVTLILPLGGFLIRRVRTNSTPNQGMVRTG